MKERVQMPTVTEMTNVAGEVASLEFDWEGYKGDDRIAKSMEAWNAQWDCLKKHDDEAREAGRVIGRHLSFPRGDGSAIYEVCAVQDDCAYLRWVYIGDGWNSPEVEDLAEVVKDPLYEGDGAILFEVPLKFVEKRLKRGDAWLEMCREAREKNDD